MRSTTHDVFFPEHLVGIAREPPDLHASTMSIPWSSMITGFDRRKSE